MSFSLGSYLLFPQERFRQSPPYPEPLPELKLPEVANAVLSNGLKIAVIRYGNLPIITLRLIILTGESASPPKFPGTATLTANMLKHGTLSLSAFDFEEKIESMGGNLTISTYPDYSMITLNLLEDYLDQGLYILSRMLLQPSFSKREVENAKRSLYYELIKENSNSEQLAKKVLFLLLFKDHPYQKSALNPDFIKNIKRENLLAFFQKYYRPNNSQLILTGNLNLTTATRKTSRYLNTWSKKEIKLPFVSAPHPNNKLKICFVDLPQQKTAMIYMGNIIYPLSSLNYFPLLVLNQVLGGTPGSRLFMNLRESKEYAYYAFSQIELFKICGLFYIRAKVRPEVIYPSVMEILTEINKISKEKMPSFEIEQAKSYLIGNFPLKIETHNLLSSRLAQIKAFQLGPEHWSKYYQNLMLIDADRVFEIAQKYSLLTPIVVIVGDKNIIIDHLRNFNEVEIYNNKGILQYSIKKESSDEIS
ncbi:MAG: M16 family metallopeptidase [Candidatus Aminicenantales bacterium]